MSKKVNVELNMTPFIGLFALLVVMLLLTAVWNHISTLSTDISSSTAGDSAAPSDPNKVTLNVTVLKSKIEMSDNKYKPMFVEHINDGINKAAFISKLDYWKKLYPKKTDVILGTEDSVTYNHLIETFDTLVGNGWPDVGVSTQ
jgi:biopolymer transport protein ExbD